MRLIQLIIKIVTHITLLWIILAPAFVTSATKEIYPAQVHEKELEGIKQDIKAIKMMQGSFLQEIYKNNLEKIQLLFMVATGIFAFVGYKNMREVDTIKLQYVSELSKCQELSRKHEIVLAEHQAHDQRIRLLELQNEIFGYLKRRNFVAALEKIVEGQNIDNNNALLLHYKAIVCFNMHRHNDALELYEKILESDISPIYIVNLLEICLLAKQLRKYTKYCELYKERLDTMFTEAYPSLELYFTALKAYIENDISTLSSISIQLQRSKLPLIKWYFDECIYIIGLEPPSEGKKLLTHIITCLKGDVPDTYS